MYVPEGSPTQLGTPTHETVCHTWFPSVLLVSSAGRSLPPHSSMMPVPLPHPHARANTHHLNTHTHLVLVRADHVPGWPLPAAAQQHDGGALAVAVHQLLPRVVGHQRHALWHAHAAWGGVKEGTGVLGAGVLGVWPYISCSLASLVTSVMQCGTPMPPGGLRRECARV